MSKNTLLVSVDMIKERTGVHDNVDEKLIFPVIKLAQDMFIEPILGTALFNKILDDFEASGTTVSPYKELVDDYIVDPIIYYTLAKLPHITTYQFWNKGLMRKTSDNSDLPDPQTISDVAREYQNAAEFYGDRLARYLKQYATESNLSEYLHPGDGIDIVVPEAGAFTMPIDLGGDCGCRGIDNYREIHI